MRIVLEGGISMTGRSRHLALSLAFLFCLAPMTSADTLILKAGQRIEGETLLILLNAHHEPIPFQLPAHDHVAKWELVLDTARPNGESHAISSHASEPRTFAADEKYDLRERSLVLLRLGKSEQAGEQAAAGSSQ